MTRVALVWPNFESSNACGVRGRAFARAYAECGADVRVFAPPAEGFDADLPGTYAVEGLPLVHDIADLRDLSRRDRALREALRAFKPDVIQASSPSILTMWQAARAARKLGIPWIADVRDLVGESWRAAFGPKLKYVVLERFIEGPLYRRADAVFVVTGLQGERLRELYGAPESRVHVYANGADMASYEDVPRVPDTDVLFVGALLDKGRRGEELVRAYARVLAKRPETRFRFLGWVDSRYADGLVTLMDGLGISDQVERVGRVPHAEVAAHLGRARVGVVPVQDAPIFRTAMGAKTYEYLAAGLPLAVLGPRGRTELRMLVETHQVGVYADSWEAFADDLAGFLADADALEGASARARKVATRFDRGAIAREAFTRVLRPLASGRAPEPREPGARE